MKKKLEKLLGTENPYFTFRFAKKLAAQNTILKKRKTNDIP